MTARSIAATRTCNAQHGAAPGHSVNHPSRAAFWRGTIVAGGQQRTCTMQPPRRCTTQCRASTVGVPRKSQSGPTFRVPTNVVRAVDPVGRTPAAVSCLIAPPCGRQSLVAASLPPPVPAQPGPSACDVPGLRVRCFQPLLGQVARCHGGEQMFVEGSLSRVRPASTPNGLVTSLARTSVF
jgi:hypothetical protein